MGEPVSVPKDYHCPFCPNHQDDVFYETPLINQPICEGCRIELSFFSDEEELREDHLITAVERYTGLPWRACQCILLHYERQSLLQIRESPPASYRRATEETPALTEEEARLEIDAHIHFIDALVRKFKEQLPEEVWVKIQAHYS